MSGQYVVLLLILFDNCLEVAHFHSLRELTSKGLVHL